MPLLKDGRFVPDPWVHLGVDDAVPLDGDVMVPFARLLAHYDVLAARSGRLGVVFSNVERAEALRLFLPRLDLIVLPFPSFTDGRAYSLARQLREFGYAGELRASGNVLPDQLQFMIEVGFDAFEVTDRFPETVWQRAACVISLGYQTACGRAHVWQARHRDAEPWYEQPHAG